MDLPQWAQTLEQVIRSCVFPYLQASLDLKEDKQLAASASAEYASKLSRGHEAATPQTETVGGHALLGGGEPTLFHHMVVNYSANLEPHHDPAYLGHVIVSSSMDAADLVLTHPHGGAHDIHRIHLAPGDIYVLMGDARYKWIHEIQLTEQAVRTSVVSRYWLKGHEFKECKWDPRHHTWWRQINGASAL